MQCQRLVLVGDAHLGRESRDAERALLAFLDTVPSLGDGLLVTGDLFEFWFSYRRAVPRRGSRVVAALAALRRRVPILMIGGNHDRWGGSFWPEELDIEFAAHEAVFTLAGRAALAVHGDGTVELDRPARLLHRVTSHQATISLFGALHPDLGMWLVDRLSGALGARARSREDMMEARERQQRWALARLEREPELALVAMGHTHVAATVEAAPGRRYLNPGAWFDGYRYAVVDESGATLAQFQP